MSKFKCQKCRRELFDSAFVLTNHSEPWTMSQASPCSAGATVWYLKDEVVETWLQIQLDASEWVKGKIHCPHCTLRLGSFDFVSGTQCNCGQHVLPPIHITKSRVDHENSEFLKRALDQFVQKPPDEASGDGQDAVTDPIPFTMVTEAEVSTAASASLAANAIGTE